MYQVDSLSVSSQPKKKNCIFVYSKGHYLKGRCTFMGFEVLMMEVMKSYYHLGYNAV
jgi:hypothetical protein